MTQFEFDEQVRRLGRAYGEKVYSTERVKLIWRRFRNCDVRIFAEAIDNLIADSLQAPLASKIAEAVHAVAKLRPELNVDPYDAIRKQIELAQQERVHCPKCYNFGTIYARRKDKQGFPEECLLCDCRLGELAGDLPEHRKLPKWLHYYGYYYFLDSEKAGNEALAKFAHVHSLPREKRIGELMRIINETHNNLTKDKN